MPRHVLDVYALRLSRRSSSSFLLIPHHPSTYVRRKQHYTACMLPSRHQAACALVRANSSSSSTTATLLRQAAAAATPSRSSLRNASSHSAPSIEASRNEVPPIATRPESWSRLQRSIGAAQPRSADIKAAAQSAIATAQGTLLFATRYKALLTHRICTLFRSRRSTR